MTTEFYTDLFYIQPNAKLLIVLKMNKMALMHLASFV